MKEHPNVGIKHILYATDLSEDARYAFDYALNIANQFNAKLTLLHVIREELLDLLIFDVGIDRLPSMKKRFTIEKEHLQKTRTALMEKVKNEYGWDIAETDEIVVEKGSPVKVILRVAEEQNCDLIVMGRKGKGTLEDAMMGDTVRRVLHRSKRPVLVARHPEEK